MMSLQSLYSEKQFLDVFCFVFWFLFFFFANAIQTLSLCEQQCNQAMAEYDSGHTTLNNVHVVGEFLLSMRKQC